MMKEYTVIDTKGKLYTVDAINEEWLVKILKADNITIKKILEVV